MITSRATMISRKSLWRMLTVVVSVGCLVSGGLLLDRSVLVNADIAFSQRPTQVKSGHLIGDPVPGRKDYVFRTKSTTQGLPNSLAAYTPEGQLLFSITPDGGFNELIDVVDLDGDGNCEIIGISRGDF